MCIELMPKGQNRQSFKFAMDSQGAMFFADERGKGSYTKNAGTHTFNRRCVIRWNDKPLHLLERSPFKIILRRFFIGGSAGSASFF